MNALRIHARGGPTDLVYESAPAPEPGTGDALVEVHTASYTPDELQWRRRRTSGSPAREPHGRPGHRIRQSRKPLGREQSSSWSRRSAMASTRSRSWSTRGCCVPSRDGSAPSAMAASRSRRRRPAAIRKSIAARALIDRASRPPWPGSVAWCFGFVACRASLVLIEQTVMSRSRRSAGAGRRAGRGSAARGDRVKGARR
jgi:hypothetical protein